MDLAFHSRTYRQHNFLKIRQLPQWRKVGQDKTKGRNIFLSVFINLHQYLWDILLDHWRNSKSTEVNQELWKYRKHKKHEKDAEERKKKKKDKKKKRSKEDKDL